MGRLDRKVAIITGAGTGMGKAAASLFAKEGAKVVVADYVAESGEETAKEIRDAGGEAIFVKTDVSKPEEVKNLIKAAVDTYGKLNVLYNNAGIAGEPNPTAECTDENWQKVTTTNLYGVFLGMKYAIPEMLKTGGGAIINTASMAADRGLPNLPAYCASKGGVVALSRTTAVEYADKNIRVNCINPATVATPLVVAMGKEVMAQHISAIPQGRAAEPVEIAYAALFLASDECPFLTGHALVIDGGLEADSRQKG